MGHEQRFDALVDLDSLVKRNVLVDADRSHMIELLAEIQSGHVHQIILQAPSRVTGDVVGIADEIILQIHGYYVEPFGRQVIGKQRGTTSQVEDFLSALKCRIQRDPDDFPIEEPGKVRIVGRVSEILCVRHI